MASNSKSSLSTHPFALAIGIIAGVATICGFCIAAYTFLTGRTSISKPPTQQPTLEIRSTSIQLTDIIPSTDIPPLPDNPTEASMPPASIPETQPGTVLEVGEAWRQGKLELRLTGREVYPKIILAFFTVTNIGTTQRVIEYSQDNFSAVDTLNRRIDTGGVDWNFDPFVQHTCSSNTAILDPNDYETILIYCERGNFEGVALAVDVTDNSITEIVITASGISSINDAQWRIPIIH